jgi:hypothetical protein
LTYTTGKIGPSQAQIIHPRELNLLGMHDDDASLREIFDIIPAKAAITSTANIKASHPQHTNNKILTRYRGFRCWVLGALWLLYAG